LSHEASVKPAAKRIGAGVLAAAVTTVALLGSFVGPAFADDPPITLTPATQTVEYGQYWSINGSSPAFDSYCEAIPCTSVPLTITSGSLSRTIPNFPVYQGQFSLGVGDLLPQTDLGVGTHTINVSYPDDSGTETSSPNPAKVVITPTAVLTTTTIAPDPNNSRNALITSQLSGKYIEQLPSCACEGQNGFLLPAGTWKLTVTDSSGRTVFTKQSSEPANGLPSFVNYWPDVPAGETYSAQSTFTVSGGAAVNFTITSQKFSWTSQKDSAGGVAAPSATPKPKTIKTASFAPPLVVFYGVLLVALILIALDVVLLVQRARLRRAVAPSNTEPES
jgi:hypothetical protein